MEHSIDLEGVLGVLAGIIFIVMSLSIPLVYIFVRYRRQRRAMELYHAERMAAIERGMEVPPNGLELLAPVSPKPVRTALLPGLVWFFIGIAITVSLGIVDEHQALMAGFIPIAIGLAYLVYYFVEERKKPAQNS